MGWTTEHATRDEVVTREIGPWKSVEGATVTAIKHSRTGDEDWFLLQAEKDGIVTNKFIMVMIWEQGAHKEMDEACGPYYYNCPVSWLDEVPLPEYGNSAAWRAEVRRRAALKADNGLCGYIAIYRGKRIEVYAPTVFAAQKKAAGQLLVPANKQYLISVTLCERADGSEVVHTPDF